MPRPQFTLKSMLWSTAVVGAFLGGKAWHRHFDEPAFTIQHGRGGLGTLGSRWRVDWLVIDDGSEWFRVVYTGAPGTHSFDGPNGEIISIRPSVKARQNWKAFEKESGTRVTSQDQRPSATQE